MSETSGLDAKLAGVDANKRATLRRMATMTFVAPVVASFAMDAMTVGTALAQSGNGTIDTNS